MASRLAELVSDIAYCLGKDRQCKVIVTMNILVGERCGYEHPESGNWGF